MNFRILKKLSLKGGDREKKKQPPELDVDHTDFGHPANEIICNELPVSPDSVACSGGEKEKKVK